MIDYTEYRFVLSRPNGLRDVGTGAYSAPLHRGEVVHLTDHAARMPDGRRFPPVAYLIEQVVHAVDVQTPEVAAADPHHTKPRPHTVARPVVFVRLLDDAGQPVPVASGPIPGVVVTRSAPLSTPTGDPDASQQAAGSPASPAAPAPSGGGP